MAQGEIIGGGSSGRGFNLPIPGCALKGIVIVVVVFALFVVVLNVCFAYVRPNEYGIKERKLGPNKGIQQKVYQPGLVFRLPFGIEFIHRFPRDVQVLELTSSPTRPSKRRHFDRAAKIQTSDGFYVDVDATILYRIIDPYKVITTLGPGRLYLDNGILPKAEPFLKQAFGELTTENFYNSPLRVAKAQKARDLLDAELSPKGIEVDHVLVRYFKYSDEIQKNIEEKKLQDQLVFKNQSETKAAMEAANLKRIKQEGEMNVKITLQEGDAYRVRKTAEKDMYVRTKEAEADLLVKLAEAKRTELKNEAMQVLGSDRMVARRMAEVLKGLEVIIVPSGGETGFNPLDLDQVLELFDVKGRAPGASPASIAAPAQTSEEAVQ